MITMKKEGVFFLISCLLPVVLGRTGCGGRGCQPQTNPPSQGCQCNCLSDGGSGVLGNPCPTSSILSCGYNYALTNTTPIPSGFGQRVQSSPFYIITVQGTTSPVATQANAICATIFRLTSSALFLVVRSTVYNNGSVAYDSYFLSDIPGAPGCSRGSAEMINQGPNTVVVNDCLYNTACSSTSTIIALVRRYLFQTGNSVNDILQPIAFAEVPDPPQQCVDETIAFYQSLGFSDVVQLPYTLPYQCVTQLNGLKCINYKKVPRQNSIVIRPD